MLIDYYALGQLFDLAERTAVLLIHKDADYQQKALANVAKMHAIIVDVYRQNDI